MANELEVAFQSGFQKEAQSNQNIGPGMQRTGPFDAETQFKRYAREVDGVKGMNFGDALLPQAELALKEIGEDWKKYDPGYEGKPMPKDVYINLVNQLQTWKNNPDKRPEKLRDKDVIWHQLNA